MLVKNWMSKPAVTIEADAPIRDAIGLLKQHNIRMLPVMEEDRLVGIITDSDLKRASASDVVSLEIHELVDLIERIKVKTVMTKNPVTVPYDHTVEEAAVKFFLHNISGAPVVDQVGKVIGIITKNDIFQVLISLTGCSKKGIQFAFKLSDRPGAIKEVTDIIRDCGGRIASILNTREGVEKDYLKVYVRTYGLDMAGRQRLKKVIKETAPLLYIIDHWENTREIFE
jgi:acetoin utilization protein AcuB